MCVFFSLTEGNSFRGFLFNDIAVMVHLDWNLLLWERICSCGKEFAPGEANSFL